AGNQTSATGRLVTGLSAVPTIDVANATTISGTGEPGATVTVTDDNGQVLGETTVKDDGTWSIPTPAGTPSGPITATVTDPTGHQATATADLDTDPPAVPTIDVANATEISGTGEPGATLTVTDHTGTVLGETTVNNDGTWSIPTPAGTPSGMITATATDPAGNQTSATGRLVTGLSAIPTIDVANATTISGTGEPGSTVTITDGNGQVLGETTVDDNGTWSVPTPAGTPSGPITATVTDPTGHPATATADLDTDPPAVPVIEVATSDLISGTAEPGLPLTVTDTNGTVLGHTTVDETGHWTVPLSDATGEVTVTVTDPAGNPASATTIIGGPGTPTPTSTDTSTPTSTPTATDTSTPTSTPTSTDTSTPTTSGTPTSTPTSTPTTSGTPSGTPTSTPTTSGTPTSTPTTSGTPTSTPTSTPTPTGPTPSTPVVQVANAKTISGTADPGTTITVTDEQGTLLGETTVGPDGTWSVPTPAGTPTGPITVTSTNPQGGSSTTTSQLDTTPPAVPHVNQANSDQISGTADPGTTITITDQTGNILGETTAAADGTWSVKTPAGTPSGTVTVTVTDQTGTTASVTAELDTTLPAAPHVTQANSDKISGTAEPGTTITITDQAGLVLGQTTVNADGTWSVKTPAGTPSGTVTVTVTNTAGNRASTVAELDTTPPAVPRVTVATSDTISGTADPGTTITVTDKAGNILGQTEADKDGNWSIKLAGASGQVTVTATDAAGNQSATTVTLGTARITVPTGGTVGSLPLTRWLALATSLVGVLLALRRRSGAGRETSTR
ncbi:MAG: Ig-like domain-containing protein, partial [Propionibacteriaceae bacterium]|nr:Ig-like domain-containing protein [Propionibacteriaceae bacterium]